MAVNENGDYRDDDDGTQSVSADDMARDRTPVSGRWASALRRLLEERGITQLELAALAGIDKDTVSNIMRGESSSTATLEKLAQALGVDVSELALTDEQARVLAESRVRGDDLARRISKELSASVGALVAPAAPPRKDASRRVDRGSRREDPARADGREGPKEQTD